MKNIADLMASDETIDAVREKIYDAIEGQNMVTITAVLTGILGQIGVQFPGREDYMELINGSIYAYFEQYDEDQNG